MEKFAILNLLKAIDSLNSVSATEKEPSPPAAAPASPTETKSSELPNVMAETLMRHETISNRLRNKK